MERGRCDERRLIQLKQTTGIAALNASLSRKTRLASLLQQTSYDSQRQRCEGHYGTGQICGGVPWSGPECVAFGRVIMNRTSSLESLELSTRSTGVVALLHKSSTQLRALMIQCPLTFLHNTIENRRQPKAFIHTFIATTPKQNDSVEFVPVRPHGIFEFTGTVEVKE